MSSTEKESTGQPMEMQVLRVVKEEASRKNSSNALVIPAFDELLLEAFLNTDWAGVGGRKKGNPLSTSSNYGDNLFHLSAANDCNHIIKEILKKKGIADINWKNDCGWTPLMQAIRNGNTEAVKLLLANDCTPCADPYADISPIGLAAAMGLEMFEIVYAACPAALDHAKDNTISPLCAAVVREDKQLFFRLLDLGVDVSEASECTLMLMRQSRIPEIAKLAEAHSATEDYWSENWDTVDCIGYLQDHFHNPRMSSTLDNIEESEEDGEDDPENMQNSTVPNIRVIPPCDVKINERKNSEPLRLNIPASADAPRSLISPRLAYTRQQTFPVSPNPSFTARKKKENSEIRETPAADNSFEDFRADLTNSSDGKMLLNSTFTDESKVHKYKNNRPPNLNISKDDSGGSEYLLEYEKSNSSMLSSETPMEPRHETPSTAIISDDDQKKLAILLQRFGLTHLLFTFLAEEVDLDLFFTLNDQDLQEIGIENRSDRKVLLQVITQCNGYNMKGCLSN